VLVAMDQKLPPAARSR